MSSGSVEVRHGYDLDDLDRLARVATQVHWTMAADAQDRYAEAYGAIVEMLYSAEDPPTERGLIGAGQSAIREWVRGTHRTHGLHLDAERDGTPSATAVYWWEHTRPTSSPEARVVDVHTLAQVWPMVDERGREALTAVAAHDGDYRAAAAALGIGTRALGLRVRHAAENYLHWWHEGEQPSRIWRRRRVQVDMATVPCGTVSAYHRHRRRGEPSCEDCREALRRARRARAAA